MKALFIFLTFAASLATHGQQTVKSHPAEKFPRFLIGINFSPDYAFRTLKKEDGSSAGSTVEVRNNVEVAKFGYTTGINAGIKFNQQIGLEAGVQYSVKGYKMKKQGLVFAQPEPNRPIAGSKIYDYQYLDIPVKINFTVGKGKVRFFSSAGLIANIFLTAKETAIYEYADGKSNTVKQTSAYDFKKLNLSPMISIGVDYTLSDQMHVRAAPTFRYGLLKIMDAPVKEYLWNAGFNIGFYYVLK